MNKWVNRKLDEKRSTGKGFTLIELLVVITVLGILAAIVAYAVENLSAEARTAAGGTSQSEIAQAEQQYCQQNGTYGALPDLVNAGLLSNPSPNLQIYISSIPANAQIYAACSASSAGGSSISATGAAPSSSTAGTVYDVYPQTITQPDGSQAVIPAPPTTVVTAGTPATVEDLAVLGVMPYGGDTYVLPAEYQPEYGTNEISPLINGTNFVTLGSSGNPNVQLFAAAKPQLIVDRTGYNSSTTNGSSALEAIAPLFSTETTSLPGARQNATGSGVTAIPPGASPATPAAGDPSVLPWYNQVIALGTILNRQAQAAAFITDFKNAAQPIITALQGAGVTVSVVLPNFSGSTLSSVTVVGPSDEPYADFLDYVGATVVGCPVSVATACSGIAGGVGVTAANFSAAYVPGRYLEIVGNQDPLPANEAPFVSALSSPPFSTLPQVANSTPGCWQGGGAQGTGTCYVWGPTVGPGYYPPALGQIGTNGTNGAIAPTLPAPLSSYCVLAGVAVDANGNGCPGYPTVPAGSAPSYTPVSLPQGVWAGSDGPLNELAAMLAPGTGTSSVPSIEQDF